jgi:hypothetical protein
MKKINEKEPTRRPWWGEIDWLGMMRNACLECDWSPLLTHALGPRADVPLFVDGLHKIGWAIDARIRADAEEKRRSEAEVAQRTEVKRQAEARAYAAWVKQIVEDAFAHTDRARTKANARKVNAATDAPRANQKRSASPIDDKMAEAAALLGVTVDASEDQIRAALRGHFASSRLHTDQGGDGERAKQLIAAKNLMVERARAARP